MIDQKSLEDAEKSLSRLQNLDTSALPRIDQLGSELNFLDAVPPAERLIGLFKQIPVEHLKELPKSQLSLVQSQADSTYNLLQQVLDFDPKEADAYARRTSIISSITQEYGPAFERLALVIAYAASRQRDFGALEREARSAVQAAKDRADEATKALEAQQEQARQILDEVRRVAAEQGVSQQAIYFQSESGSHETEAKTWQQYTIYVASGLGVYAALSAVIHKVPFLTPADSYQTVQLALSKVLVFGVIAYMLVLCARNFLAHRHNAVVNRHRYNALLTFTALADAAKGSDSRDIVLTHAASCIFSPQDTGYTKGQGQPESVANVVQTLPRIATSAAQ